jgi:hypothetical protein
MTKKIKSIIHKILLDFKGANKLNTANREDIFKSIKMKLDSLKIPFNFDEIYDLIDKYTKGEKLSSAPPPFESISKL